MGDLITDLQMALIIIVFVYVIAWATELTKSKKIGVILALIIVYLTVYQHFSLLLIVIVLFFGYAFWDKFTAQLE